MFMDESLKRTIEDIASAIAYQAIATTDERKLERFKSNKEKRERSAKDEERIKDDDKHYTKVFDEGLDVIFDLKRIEQYTWHVILRYLRMNNEFIYMRPHLLSRLLKSRFGVSYGIPDCCNALKKLVDLKYLLKAETDLYMINYNVAFRGNRIPVMRRNYKFDLFDSRGSNKNKRRNSGEEIKYSSDIAEYIESNNIDIQNEKELSIAYIESKSRLQNIERRTRQKD